MKSISLVGWFYLLMGTGTCVYLGAAGIGGWQAPEFGGAGGSGSGSRFGSSSSYSRSSTYGRSWGGSWGGGK